MKLLSVIGTRPQFIKLFSICRAVKLYNLKNKTRIIHRIINTGQHFDIEMSQVFIDELGIDNPDFNLEIVEKSQCMQISRMIAGLEKILMDENPDMVLVYGDTNSTLSGALAAKKLNFTLGHIEAGLRSFNRKMPEEINRIMTDKISDFLFCPTKTAFLNLKKEGYLSDNQKYLAFDVGDVTYDSFKFFKEISQKQSNILKTIFGNGILQKYILVTIHRAENTDNIDKLQKIIDLLAKISQQSIVIFPVHPRTKLRLAMMKNTTFDNRSLILIKPVSYFDMMVLEKNAGLILTDSGGVQKEAYFNNKKCITLRTETEWVETLKKGRNILAGPDFNIVENMINTSKDKYIYKKSIFGDGFAGEKIIKILADHFFGPVK